MYELRNRYYIVGMMGVGKTTVAEYLSDKLGLSYEDLDECIEVMYTAGEYSVAEIIDLKGEYYFRNIESQALEELLEDDVKIVSLGGGTVLDEYNRKLIKNKGKVIFLTGQPETIYDRLNKSYNRPLLKENFSVENVTDVLNERKSIYRNVADYIIETDNKNVEQIGYEIIDLMRKNGDLKDFKVIVSVAGEDIVKLLTNKDFLLLNSGLDYNIDTSIVDIIEVRWDTLESVLPFDSIQKVFSNDLLFTYRTELDDKTIMEDLEEQQKKYQDIILDAINSKLFHYVDIEYKSIENDNNFEQVLIEKKKVVENFQLKYILSSHIYNDDMNIEQMKLKILQMNNTCGDIIKIAMKFNTVKKGKEFLKEIYSWYDKQVGLKPLLFTPMGKKMKNLRKSLYKYNCFGQFSYIGENPIAEGQLSLKELLESL